MTVVLTVASCAKSKEVEPSECIKDSVQCDETKAKSLVCVENEEGMLVFEATQCAPGTECDPATGQCPNLCGECNTPPNDCFKREGTCWNGECQYELGDGQRCDDGDPCTLNDVCLDGECQPGGQKECGFVPADECIDDKTLRAFASAGKCENGSCVYPSTEVDCSLGCEGGACKGDPCKDVICKNPPNACYKEEGVCNAGTCSYLPDDGKECDDTNACTEGDKCANGKCNGTVKVCETPPDNECKDDTTLISYNKQGSCKDGDCSYESSEVPCSHGCDAAEGACKGALCDNITCETPPNDCYKSSGSCREGKCEYDPDNGKSCDDENVCTEDDLCTAGECKGSAVVCNTPPANTCKDATTLVVHTAPGTCNDQGTCDYAMAEVTCSAGCDSATGSCSGDPCAGVVCDDPPNDQCYSVPGLCSAGNCTYLPKSDVACDDGKACTKNDVCKSTGDCQGDSYTCDDSLICTDDTCDGDGGCVFPIKQDSCLVKIGAEEVCLQKDQLNVGVIQLDGDDYENACQVCMPGENQSHWGVASGDVVLSWNFDDGTPQGWTITQAFPGSLVTWQPDQNRSVSAPWSMYFGDPDTYTYDDGERVGALLTSPVVDLSGVTSGKICFEFKMYKSAEASSFFDQLVVLITDAVDTTALWQSGIDVNYGNTGGEFITYSVDISDWAGEEIEMDFYFDSVDEFTNGLEGVYIDDIRILKNCTP